MDSEAIKNLFDYKDGELVWNKTRNNRAVRGNIAGCIDSSHGYREIGIDGKRHYAHRLIWVYFNGSIPEGCSIDHINHKPSDNQIENLRLVSHQENHRNQRVRKNNTSGFNGVNFIEQKKKWKSQIMVSGKGIHLGYFDTLHEAISMRLFANSYYGFHTNHGGA